jgi:hypothetical protein
MRIINIPPDGFALHIIIQPYASFFVSYHVAPAYYSRYTHCLQIPMLSMVAVKA